MKSPVLFFCCLSMVMAAPPRAECSINFQRRLELNPHKTSAGQEIIKGDIILEHSDRKFVANEMYHWPIDPQQGVPVIPYYISHESENDRVAIRNALTYWETNTCIRFEETTNTNQVHMHFIKDGNGCYSVVGYDAYYPQRTISIGQGCEDLPATAHEIGHNIGFFHEQDRSDRDENLEMRWENLDPNDYSIFQKEETINDVEYDYSSLMQYIARAWSINGKITMMPHDPYVTRLMGNAPGLTFRDLLSANTVYGCVDKWESECGSRMCNEGYVGHDCTCVCPRGTTGDDCSQVEEPYYPPVSCGGNVTSADGSFNIQSPNYPSHFPGNEWCMWWVKGNPGQRIKVTFHHFDLLYRADGQCYWDRMEIRTQDAFTDGNVYCEQEIKPGQSFTSDAQEMFISFEAGPYEDNTDNGFDATVEFI